MCCVIIKNIVFLSLDPTQPNSRVDPTHGQLCYTLWWYRKLSLPYGVGRGADPSVLSIAGRILYADVDSRCCHIVDCAIGPIGQLICWARTMIDTSLFPRELHCHLMTAVHRLLQLIPPQCNLNVLLSVHFHCIPFHYIWKHQTESSTKFSNFYVVILCFNYLFVLVICIMICICCVLLNKAWVSVYEFSWR